MKTIKLTNSIGQNIRVIAEHIVAYGPTEGGSSELMLDNHTANECLRVKETADEIDKLLEAV